MSKMRWYDWIWYDIVDFFEDVLRGLAMLVLFVIAFIVAFLPFWLNMFWGVAGWPLGVSALPIFVGFCWFLGSN